MGSAMEVEKHGYDVNVIITFKYLISFIDRYVEIQFLITIILRLQRSKLDENLKSLDLSSKGEVFKTVFGRFQKIKDLNLPLSVGNFREFDLEYRTNFQTIHSFIELYVSIFFLYVPTYTQINQLRITFVSLNTGKIVQ